MHSLTDDKTDMDYDKTLSVDLEPAQMPSFQNEPSQQSMLAGNRILSRRICWNNQRLSGSSEAR